MNKKIIFFKENKFFSDLNPDLWDLTGDPACLADVSPNLDEMLFYTLDDENKEKEKELKNTDLNAFLRPREVIN
jgi:hypothetical protein